MFSEGTFVNVKITGNVFWKAFALHQIASKAQLTEMHRFFPCSETNAICLVAICKTSIGLKKKQAYIPIQIRKLSVFYYMETLVFDSLIAATAGTGTAKRSRSTQGRSWPTQDTRITRIKGRPICNDVPLLANSGQTP